MPLSYFPLNGSRKREKERDSSLFGDPSLEMGPSPDVDRSFHRMTNLLLWRVEFTQGKQSGIECNLVDSEYSVLTENGSLQSSSETPTRKCQFAV